MASIVVQYSGQRKTFRLSSTMASVQTLVPQIATAFGVEATEIALRHRGKPIDKSTPFSMSGLSNNTELDLAVIKAVGKKEAHCKIALSIEGEGSVNTTCESSLTLRELLESLVAEGKLNAESLAPAAVPSIIYMRQQFSAEAMATTTLASMGLAGLSARLQLRYTKSTPTDAAVEQEASPMEISETLIEVPDNTSSSIIPSTSLTADTAADSRVLIASPMLQRVAESQLEANTARFRSLVQQVCGGDVSSAAAALRTVSTLLVNVVTFPRDAKYRSIRRSNKVLQTKLIPVPGALELIFCVGFESSEDDEDLLTLSADVKPLALAEYMMILNGAVAEQERALEEAHAAAVRATQQTPVPIEFDPFRASIFRTQSQPRAADSKSSTERKLEELQRKQRVLEGEVPEDLEAFRSTQLLFPVREGAADAVVAPVVAEDKELPDGRVLAQGLASKIRSMAEGGDGSDAPLLTKAIRDLEAAKKTKVYSYSLVKIKFPDRVTLQGFFHPREAAESLYSWVSACLCDDAGDFDLYTTPPRRVLERPRGLASPPTFADLQLVPAVVIYVSWRESVVAERYKDGEAGCYLAEDAVAKYSCPEKAALAFPRSTALVASTERGPRSLEAQAEDASLAASGPAEEKDGPAKKSSKPKWLKI